MSGQEDLVRQTAGALLLARNGRLPSVLRRGFPEASFLLRLVLTLAAVLATVTLLRQ